MRIAYLDCFAGISGDMTVGALLSAGLPMEHLTTELARLPLTGFTVSSRTLERSMISAVKFDVILESDERKALASDHSHAHHHDHDHHRDHDHQEVHVHTHGYTYRDIQGMITSANFSSAIQERALDIFRHIAIAESEIHGVAIEDVHFHEVGAIDSIVDIVAVAIGLDYFGVEECRSRVVPLGAGGTIRTAHGLMPIPTPATLSILKNYPVELGAVHSEMTTPTGAGIVRATSGGILSKTEALSPVAIGYGAGSKEFAEVPNLLRIVIGELPSIRKTESASRFQDRDTICQMTTCIDDMAPTMLAYVQERLMSEGALDVYIRPIVMKKGRAAHELVVLAKLDQQETLLRIISEETPTLGVRIEHIDRRIAQRTTGMYESGTFGPLHSKTTVSPGKTETHVEFEEMRRIALERKLPIQEVNEQLKRELL